MAGCTPKHPLPAPSSQGEPHKLQLRSLCCRCSSGQLQTPLLRPSRCSLRFMRMLPPLPINWPLQLQMPSGTKLPLLLHEPCLVWHLQLPTQRRLTCQV